MHPSVAAFVRSALSPADVAGKTVLEAGAMDVNGTVRPDVEALGPFEYVATDMRDGPGVDYVVHAGNLPEFMIADVVISTEMLEHCRDWTDAMAGLIGAVAEGGLLVVTTRSPGFGRHDHPHDYWRFPVPVMREILEAAGMTVLACEADPQPSAPGVFAAARKPPGWSWPPDWERRWEAAGVCEADPAAVVHSVRA